MKIAINPKNYKQCVCVDEISDGVYVFDKAGDFLNKINCDNLNDITAVTLLVILLQATVVTEIVSDSGVPPISVSAASISNRKIKTGSISNLAISLTGTLYISESWKDEKDIHTIPSRLARCLHACI